MGKWESFTLLIGAPCHSTYNWFVGPPGYLSLQNKPMIFYPPESPLRNPRRDLYQYLNRIPGRPDSGDQLGDSGWAASAAPEVKPPNWLIKCYGNPQLIYILRAHGSPEFHSGLGISSSFAQVGKAADCRIQFTRILFQQSPKGLENSPTPQAYGKVYLDLPKQTGPHVGRHTYNWYFKGCLSLLVEKYDEHWLTLTNRFPIYDYWLSKSFSFLRTSFSDSYLNHQKGYKFSPSQWPWGLVHFEWEIPKKTFICL